MSVTSRHLANYNDTRAEGRISYGHLGRTNLFNFVFLVYLLAADDFCTVNKQNGSL